MRPQCAPTSAPVPDHGLTAEARVAATRPWTAEERDMWRPAERLTVSQWADRYRVLAGDGALEPGQWSTDRAPYMREPMDALGPVGPWTDVVFMASARVGKTEIGNNAIAYWVDTDPDPVGMYFPDESTAQEEIRDRVEPMLKASPRTARLFTDSAWDVKKKRIKLATCIVRVGWSRSAATMAGYQARFLVSDEVDKWGQPRSEAEPLALIDARAMQYGARKRHYKCSTPTTDTGLISREFEACRDRRRFWVPCPHCGEAQVLRFEQLRWGGSAPAGAWEKAAAAEKFATADAVATGAEPVWFECVACEGKITDGHKEGMLAAGEWRSEGYPPGERPASQSVAYAIWAAYSPWVEFREIVADCLQSHAKGPKTYQNHVNSWRGEAYKEERTSLTPAAFHAKIRQNHPRLLAPAWTRAIVAGADLQKSSIFWTVRAFGAAGRSRGLDYGEAEDFDELVARVLERSWPVDGVDLDLVTRVLAIDVAGGVDGGDRTDKAYRFVAEHRLRVWAVKGMGGDFLPDEREPFTLGGKGKNKLHGVERRNLNTQHYKTVVANRVRDDDPTRWEEGPAAPPAYVKQMTAERQVWKHRGQRSYLWWEPRSGGAANHYFDAAVYATAAADILGVDKLPTADLLAARLVEDAREADREEEEAAERPWFRPRPPRSQREPGKWLPWATA